MMHVRKQANCARNLPLEEVTGQLGGSRNKHDKQRWDFPTCSVWIGNGKDSQRFFDHHAVRGGGGAIDLAMHVLGCDFKTALASLAALLNEEPGAPVCTAATQQPIAASTKPPSFVAPRPCPQYLSGLSEYMTQTRGLPSNIVTQAMNLGVVYPDSRRNAVFLCHSPTGEVTGAELRGTGTTPFKGMAPGSRRGIGFFSLACTAPTELVVVESALDALAYQALFPISAAYIVSTAGVMSECPALLELAEKLQVNDITIAYDNDAAGETASVQLSKYLAVHGPAMRRRLPWLKDWNDIVITNRQADTQPDGLTQADVFAEVV